MTRGNVGEIQAEERWGVERTEAANSQSPNNGYQFLKELDSITGPKSAAGAGIRAASMLEGDGFKVRVESIEFTKFMNNTQSIDLQKLAVEQRWEHLKTRPERTRMDEISRDNQQSFAHLFARHDGNLSLYGRLKNADGSLSLSRIEEELNKPGVSTKDRHTLDYVKRLADDSGFRWQLSQSDLIEAAHQHSLQNWTEIPFSPKS